MAIDHSERHRTQRIGWLRAAVLGANDGILSTASLIVGVAAADTTRETVLLTGLAGLLAGALSMAAGEYVSVSSQEDTEKADIEREKKELATDLKGEQDELTSIYIDRGLEPDLARRVALHLMAKDPLSAHARDELGISSVVAARPIQAALTSAATFAVGAALPLSTVLVTPVSHLVPVVAGISLISLAVLGALAAHTGGASILKGAARITFWGAIAMAVTAGVGSLFGASV
ncbi:MAG: VIT family protein [Candidatus Dadabacteria bacterium]|nr:VIT family protein [Candidatus Dadabacteria bacterium]